MAPDGEVRYSCGAAAGGPGEACAVGKSMPGSSSQFRRDGAPRAAPRWMRPAGRSAWRRPRWRVVLVIPTATIERVAARLESHGSIVRDDLSLGLPPVAAEGGEGSDAMVMNVDPKGPGTLAGVHQGDIIIIWNREPIRHRQSVSRVLGSEASAGRSRSTTIPPGSDRSDSAWSSSQWTSSSRMSLGSTSLA